jgi:TolB protein
MTERTERVGAAVLSVLSVFSVLSVPMEAQRAPVLQQVRVRHPYYYREMFIPQPTTGPSSVAWSPNGAELVFSMQGSLWRLRLGATEAPQLTDGPGYDYEPDWSPDGRRIVYASYRDDAIELRLLDPTTGNPTSFLTNGAVNLEPRWSPDGRRIAYISNEGGNTSLWTVEAPGGRRERIRIEKRVYRSATGTLRIVVTDAATGREVPARVSLTGADGRSYAPDDAWRHADDGFDRSERKFEYGYFHTMGSSVTTLPAGVMAVEITHGPEFRVENQRVTIRAGATETLRVALRRLDDLAARGWYNGDLHVHMSYGGAYRNDARHLAAQARGEDLTIVENLIVNKEGRVPDVGYFRGTLDPVSTRSTIIKHDQEFHTSYWGHLGLLNLKQHLVLPGYAAAYANTAVSSLVPTNADVADQAHAQGGLAGYVHPFDTDPAPADTAHALTAEFPVDVALGKVDYYEALGTHEVTARASLRSNVPIDHLEIVSNGDVVREIPLGGDRTSASVTLRLPVRASGWFLLRARSDRAIYPVLDLYPYATTGPIYVTVGARRSGRRPTPRTS